MLLRPPPIIWGIIIIICGIIIIGCNGAGALLLLPRRDFLRLPIGTPEKQGRS